MLMNDVGLGRGELKVNRLVRNGESVSSQLQLFGLATLVSAQRPG